jgi:acetoacetyl-CoA synthetase
MTVFWSPDEHASKKSQMAQFMAQVNANMGTSFQDYPTFHAWSVENPGEFWLEFWQWCDIKCQSQPDVALIEGDKMQDALWMGGAEFNFAENLLSRKDKKPAIQFTSECGDTASLTYARLWKQVAAVAQYLRDEGISASDRVCAMVPNYHLTVVCMLAVTSLGGVWCSCSPDFGVDALVTRFRQVAPLVLIAVDGHHYNGKSYKHIAKIAELQKKLSSVRSTIVLPCVGADPSPLDDAVSYEQIMQDYRKVDDIDFEQLPFSHPVYILFSSGTTGKPKCMVHGAGGTLLQHLKEHRLHGDIKPLEKMLFYTTCGWMMWNWSVSVLAAQGTLVLFDGSPFTPKKTTLFDLIDQEKVNVLGVGAKYLETCDAARLDFKQTHSLKSLRMILTTGSPLLPASYDYVDEKVKKGIQLCSISGGSDIISCFFLGNPLLPIYRGELQAAGLGMDMKVYNADGESVLDEQGELVCETAFPSMPVCFWNDHDGERYQAAYFDRFPNVWAHGDYAMIHPNMSAVIFGRSDATLNPNGVRIGTGEIYQAVAQIDEVVEACAVGQARDNDERIVLFVVLKDGEELTGELVQTIKTTIRTQFSPKHVPAVVLAVPDLPKTVNGKLVEVVVKNIVNGREPGNTSTLENPDCLTFFKERPELM